jgi:1-acyl-sn-glycerol-3-phosphate acyltransferase
LRAWIIRFFAFIRSVIFTFLYFPLLTLICSMPGVIWYKITGSRKVIDWTSNFWCVAITKYLGVQIEETGRENIPRGGCLFLFNHTSFMDIFVMVARKRGIRFGAKVELFSIPIFNWAIRAGGILPIARHNRQDAILVLREAEERARNGEKFALAPEGGRNTEEKLLPFKSGPFIFAINSGVPIVPVIIKGAQEAWPKHTLFPCAQKWLYNVSIEYLKPIESKGFTVEDRSVLSNQVREVMQAKLTC